MEESWEEQMARMQAELDATKAAVEQIESDLTKSQETVRSSDRTVEVTVGPQGNLVGLTFLENKYRTMSAAALSATILETTEKARGNMTRKVMEAFQPVMGNLPKESAAHLENLWGKITGADGAQRPGGQRPSRALHDELHEGL
ncbi:YbaB/EbfC family nucleoid-associated protein [Streptomyces zaomyceticus]|uniref:YbaB/EbfC family nucleoid-associated protein n=1 Tax=Streptomyces zaomyceticus TaxID=68286 RepID=UPI0036C9D05F